MNKIQGGGKHRLIDLIHSWYGVYQRLIPSNELSSCRTMINLVGTIILIRIWQ